MNKDKDLLNLIGLGESSVHKNYYSELQSKINELEAEKNKYKAFFFGSSNGIIQFCIDSGDILIVNPTFYKLCGYESEEDFFQNSGNLCDNVFLDEKSYLIFISELKTVRHLHQYIIKIKTKSSTLKIVSVNADINYNFDPPRVECIIEDLTDKVAAKNEIFKLTNYMKNVFDSLPSMIIGFDEDLKITHWNQPVLDNLLIDKNQIFMKNLFSIFPELREIEKEIRSGITDLNSTSNIVISYKRDKENIYENVSIIPIKGSKSKNTVLLIDDITEKVKFEKAFNHNQKMDALGQLAGGIAHDFNNLLTGILSSATLLRSFEETTENQEKFLEIIHNAASQSASLTRKLLDFSREKEINFEVVDLHFLIDQSVEMLRRTLDKRIAIETNLTVPQPACLCDVSLFENILINLGVNSADAMENQGRILISTETRQLSEHYCKSSPFNIQPGQYIHLQFQDNGSGIPKNIIDKIFDPFFTTKDIGKGTGLGLSNVFTAVKQLKGDLSVYSELGFGTVFKFNFPIYIFEGNQNFATKEIVKGSGHILLIDDEEVILETTKILIESFGYDVTERKDPLEALELIRLHPNKFDLVLADLIMPEINGEKLFEMMKLINPELPFILTSGFVKQSQINKMKAAGLKAFVSKPYDEVNLSKVLKMFIKNR
jgi:signal transduction histidine kinase/CheY-like chemotaxis protein